MSVYRRVMFRISTQICQLIPNIKVLSFLECFVLNFNTNVSTCKVLSQVLMFYFILAVMWSGSVGSAFIWVLGSGSGTVRPRRSDPFYIITYHVKWVTTSWTDGIKWRENLLCSINKILMINADPHHWGLGKVKYTLGLGVYLYLFCS